MASPTYWLCLFPDIDKPIGGVKQMHRLAECLTSLHRSSFVVQGDSNYKPKWFSSDIRAVSSSDWNFGQGLDPKSNIVIIPETYVPYLNRFPVNLPKIIFNQNASYTFGLPDKSFLHDPIVVSSLYSRKDIRAICTVSEYDRDFVATCLQVNSKGVFIIRNFLDCPPFSPSDSCLKKVSFMKRKNSRDSLIVRKLLSGNPCFAGWSFDCISNISHKKVLDKLAESTVFLSFGHPEGFGLPVGEALSRGCAVIGYSGLGGRELFRIANSLGVAWEIPFQDYLGFVSAFQEFNSLYAFDKDLLLRRLSLASSIITSHYSYDEMVASVFSMVSFVEEGFS